MIYKKILKEERKEVFENYSNLETNSFREAYAYTYRYTDAAI